MTLKRFPNWQRLLEAEIQASREKQFQWGMFDCALGACNCILAMTGVDPAAGVRGKYCTEDEALRLIGNDFEAFVAGLAAKLEMPEVGPTLGHRGDLVLTRNPLSSPALGIIDSSGRVALCASDHGMTEVSMRRWLRAWRVG